MLKLQEYSIIINESSVRLAVNFAEKSLKEKFARELLNYMLSFAKFLKPIRYFVKNFCQHYKNA